MRRKIREGVYFLNTTDWNRRLFDSLIPLPDGTSYNAYLVTGKDKTALIDTADPSMADTLSGHLKGIDKIDYIISLHSEQDHSGLIPAVLEKYPGAMVVATPRGREILSDHMNIPAESFLTVADGEELALGGKTLKFIHFPWVHWPETMLAWLREDRILFTCDLFGSHLATTDMYVSDECRVYEAAKRYYAEIMMPFRGFISKNIGRVTELDIEIIAPSHGPMYDKPSFIINAYKDWISDNTKNEVVIPYISMHGSVEKMVDHLIKRLEQKGIRAYKFDLSATDIGRLAISLVDAAALVVGTPTVLGEAHPMVSYAARLANALKPKTKFVSVMASYAWGGKAVEKIAESIPNIKAELIEPVVIKGHPGEDDLKKIDALADALAARLS